MSILGRSRSWRLGDEKAEFAALVQGVRLFARCGGFYRGSEVFGVRVYGSGTLGLIRLDYL